MKTSDLAKKHGYSKKFQQFCDALYLDGYGKDVIDHFMTRGFSEEDMIQIVLSHYEAHFGYDFLPPDEELQDLLKREYSPDDERITKKGRAKYLSHCDPDGRFRFEDFPL